MKIEDVAFLLPNGSITHVSGSDPDTWVIYDKRGEGIRLVAIRITITPGRAMMEARFADQTKQQPSVGAILQFTPATSPVPESKVVKIARDCHRQILELVEYTLSPAHLAAPNFDTIDRTKLKYTFMRNKKNGRGKLLMPCACARVEARIRDGYIAVVLQSNDGTLLMSQVARMGDMPRMTEVSDSSAVENLFAGIGIFSSHCWHEMMKQLKRRTPGAELLPAGVLDTIIADASQQILGAVHGELVPLADLPKKNLPEYFHYAAHLIQPRSIRTVEDVWKDFETDL